jgi:DNA-binding MarR family transcriptional regulator
MSEPTQIPALDFRAIAEEVSRQPDLFAAIEADVREYAVIQAARERRYDGTRTEEARAAQIVALRATGASLRAIERRLGADRRTVSAVVRAAEEQGLVPALKDVVARRMAELTERTMEMLERELDSPKPDAQLIKAGWVGAGIGADKLVAAPAPAPQLHLHAHSHRVDQDPASIYAEMLRSADVESVGSVAKALPSNGAARVDTVLDAETVRDTGSGGQVDPVVGGRVGSDSDGGAGGVASPAPSGNGDGTL